VAVNWPQGFAGAGAGCGIKPAGDDLAVLVADVPVAWAGTFTRNAAAAASVHWCRDHLGGRVKAIVCNSGNANACTGAEGEAAVHQVAASAAAALDCEPDAILVASTGTIGIQLPTDLIITALPSLVANVVPAVDDFARAIMTTDTKPKIATAGAGDATIVGVAKGAAMLAPNMATMLAFITTDARVDDLHGALSTAVSLSFDRISVDACESTNDSVFLLAGGQVPVSTKDFIAALTEVCKSLAEQMVRDAEGGSKFVRIEVSGANDEPAAVTLGKAIAASDLWRTAVNGSDPNWGRILSAMGSADRSLDLGKTSISIGAELVFDRGQPCGSLEAARKIMEADDFTVTCVVGTGSGEAEILTSDLSTDYVTLNATGTT
jgi:glutamate N-acetyltransferase/amino-acid N-acetyltransferase